jgi:hypothetical protein
MFYQPELIPHERSAFQEYRGGEGLEEGNEAQIEAYLKNKV